MKIHSLLAKILIFLVVTLSFVLPPVFTISQTVDNSAFVEWNFPVTSLILASIALFLFFIYPYVYGKSYFENSEKLKIPGWLRIIPTICLLFVPSFLLNFLSYIFPKAITNSVAFSLPATFSGWVFCLLKFMFAAFYEEVIYRLFFTDALLSILKDISHVFEKKVFVIICEILGCAVFALGHFYMGIFAVINAAIAHFILRYTYKKSGSIIPGFIAHFVYNVTSLILL